MFADACPRNPGTPLRAETTGRRIPRLRLPRSVLDAPFDRTYSKRVPIAVEQPVLYTSPFRRWKLLPPADSM